MPVKILDRGNYEIFETDHGHEILVLGSHDQPGPDP
jgi:hypothetical protein